MYKPLPTLLALLLLAFSVAAASFGVASIYRNEAASLVEEWDYEAGPPAWAWEQVHRYLWLANRLSPFDAQILDDLGQLYELPVVEAPGLETGARVDLDRALGYYRQSLALRPAWPYAWVNIALLKITQKHIDAEFALAMHSALTLGPWQSIVQASIAGGGLAVWNKLPVTIQIDVEHTVAHGLSNDPKFMPSVARQYGLFAKDE